MLNKPVKMDEPFWAVRIDGKNGPIFAVGSCSTPALFHRKKEADQFRKDLQNHLCAKCSVVPVRAKIDQVFK